MLQQIAFLLMLILAITLFTRNLRRIIANISLGRKQEINDRKPERWATLVRVALGQSKMVARPVAGALHVVVYAGFILINIEVLEILLDGIFGTHRLFAPFLGGFYNFLIAFFEVLAAGVWLACIIFLVRRNLLKLKRFQGVRMAGWPTDDANIILIVEVVLMSALLIMNAADFKLQHLGVAHYRQAGSFPISSTFAFLLPGGVANLEGIERGAWWVHIIGIFAFLNYLPYSKHLHILFAFPTTWYANLNKKGKQTLMPSVTSEVKAMLDTSFIPPPAEEGLKFGARDVTDLSWKSLMDSYSCTQCGRCTAECPANLTGKLLSPRKIVMDTRTRLEEVASSKRIGKQNDNYLLGSYIKEEELWACTTCNACTQACPINIDPLAIIVELRRHLVMEESKTPNSLSSMFSNLENNGAPWQFASSDRMNWTGQQN